MGKELCCDFPLETARWVNGNTRDPAVWVDGTLVVFVLGSLRGGGSQGPGDTARGSGRGQETQQTGWACRKAASQGTQKAERQGQEGSKPAAHPHPHLLPMLSMLPATRIVS